MGGADGCSIQDHPKIYQEDDEIHIRFSHLGYSALYSLVIRLSQGAAHTSTRTTRTYFYLATTYPMALKGWQITFYRPEKKNLCRR